jgi:hypothetical protein
MQQALWRVVAFVAILAFVVMVSGVAKTGSSGGQVRLGGADQFHSNGEQKSTEAENDDQGQSGIHQTAEIGRLPEVIPIET